jgi:hypothetical protein
MTHRAAPRLASWLLKRLGYENEPLAGDLLEEFHDGRTAIWYWRQVMTTILWMYRNTCGRTARRGSWRCSW